MGQGRGAAVSRSGLPHLLLSIASLQGLTFASQALVARVLSPQDFGSLRTTESLLSTLIVVGSLGMPTLATRFAAEPSPHREGGGLLLRLLGLALTASLACAALVTMTAGHVFPQSTASVLGALVFVLLASTASRVLQGYALGAGRIADAATRTSVLAVLSLPALLVATRWNGLSGWVMARYASEVALAIALLFTLRTALPKRARSDGPGPGQLTRLGIPIAASLLLRTGQDSIGLVCLNLLRSAAPLIGHLGLGSLLVAISSVVPGAVANVVLPRMTARRHLPGEARRLLLRSVSWGLWLTLPISVLAVLAAPPAIARLLPAYADAVPVLQVMAFIPPCRAVVAMAGSCLLAHLEVGFGLWANAAAFLAAFGLSLFAGSRAGALGVAVAALGVEAAAALAFLAAAVQVTRPTTVDRDERPWAR